MSKKVTLRSAKEILIFFEAHPELSFEQMQNILCAYTGQNIRAIVFVTASKGEKQDLEKPKRQFLEWLKENLDVLDNPNGLIPIPFFDTFKRV